jgi:putative endopeptidase
MHHVIVAVFLAVALSVLPAAAQTSPVSASGVELESLDRTANRCTDLYQFACGGWEARNLLPADRRSFGRIQERQDRNFAILRRILETPAGDGDRAKASDYYAACMNEPAIEAKGLAPFSAELARVAALKRRSDVPALLAHLQDVATILPGPAQWMSTPFFGFGSGTDYKDTTRRMAQVGVSGFALPDRDMYLKTDERTVTLRDRYSDHVQQMLSLLGEPPDVADESARAVLTIETALAAATLDAVSRRDPHKTHHPMALAELRALTPGFDWRQYFGALSAPPFSVIDVFQPDYLKAVNTIVADMPVADLQAYFRWHLVHSSALMLPAAFRQADFEFFGRALRGQQSPPLRWRECVSETDLRLGEALGKAFVEETFPPRAKADTLAMVKGIEAAMRQDLDEAAWMSADTKTAALLKLAAVVERIGYPDTWRDYRTLRISKDDALGNYQRSLTWEQARDYQRIGKPVDRGEWMMTPPTVNAYYNTQANSINFPAGMLQPPFYQAGRDAAVNYGGAGAMIGHELTHGFDDMGRAFDAQGNLRNWWTAADVAAFEERTACFADQYSQYVVAGDVHINGRLTLGENTADNGGLRLALMAYLAGPGATAQPELDGFTPTQRLFLGFAQLWCENSRPEVERLKAATNPHSSNRYRVNGPMSNMPEFREAFSCPADAAMVRQKACRVW